MTDDRALNDWFCREVLPLERSLTAYIRRNTRVAADLVDMRQEIYERVLVGAQAGLPQNTRAYLFTTARNHLINTARRARIVSFELVADLEDVTRDIDMFETERHLNARDELRWALEALNQLPPRCREVVRLRKVEGLSRAETAERMGVGIDTVEKQTTNGIRAITDFMLGGSGKVKRPATVRKLLGKRKP
ncbi:MAG: RNA polymerase sigma factor [Pseudomonadota bacterium]